VGSGENLVKEKVKNTSMRLHSGIRLSVINEVANDSMEEDNNIKSKPTMKPYMAKRKQALQKEASPHLLPQTTIARVASIL
jgi:hypothetical protein